jgi:4,5-DOPA dioxygenase extradiol
VPLRHLYPRAHVPVFQVSLPVDLSTADAIRLGAALASLRQGGVLVVGSGGLTHNLREYFQGGATGSSYTQQFTGWMRQRLQLRNSDELRRYRTLAPEAARAHPTEEHLLPLLVAFGASDASDSFLAIDGGIDHGALSMDSFVWGLGAERGQ